MTPSGRDAMTSRRSGVDTAVDPTEALCFAHDLGGSLTHVLVAAAGRALAASPEAATALVDRAAASGVGVTLRVRGRSRVAVVDGAAEDPLPALRARVDALLHDARQGILPPQDERPAVTIVEHCTTLPSAEVPKPDGGCVLEVGPFHGEPLVLSLRLHVDGRTLDLGQAQDVLDEMAALLARPYRRLL